MAIPIIDNDKAVKFHFFFIKLEVIKARLTINNIEIIYRYVNKLKFQLNAISEKPTYINIKIIKEKKNGNKSSEN